MFKRFARLSSALRRLSFSRWRFAYVLRCLAISHLLSISGQPFTNVDMTAAIFSDGPSLVHAGHLLLWRRSTFGHFLRPPARVPSANLRRVRRQRIRSWPVPAARAPTTGQLSISRGSPAELRSRDRALCDHTKIRRFQKGRVVACGCGKTFDVPRKQESQDQVQKCDLHS